MQHCSGDDTLMGSAPVWASVIILLVIGFVVGLMIGVLVMHYQQKRWKRAIVASRGPQNAAGDAAPDSEVQIAR